MKRINIFTLERLYKKAGIALIIMSTICALTVVFSLILVTKFYRESKLNVYMLDNSETYQLSLTKDVLATRTVEARAQALTVMYLLFNLSPDAYQINNNYNRLIELSGDKSLRVFYHSLNEKEKFFQRVIAENITQKILLNIEDIKAAPYKNGFLINTAGTVVITRPSTETEYNVKATFYLRQTFRSAANGHGFLVENFKLTDIANKKVKSRFLAEIVD
ncbi:MAG: hypothetical protein ACQPRJ_02325 [Solitalea-like symbiont of Acarus siro]